MMNDPNLMRQFGIDAAPKQPKDNPSALSKPWRDPFSDSSDNHELRTLRRKAKELGRQLGKAGDTIHRLRADIALLRSKDNSLIGTMYLEQRRQNDLLRAEIKEVRAEIFTTRQDLRTSSTGPADRG